MTRENEDSGDLQNRAVLELEALKRKGWAGRDRRRF